MDIDEDEWGIAPIIIIQLNELAQTVAYQVQTQSKQVLSRKPISVLRS